MNVKLFIELLQLQLVYDYDVCLSVVVASFVVVIIVAAAVSFAICFRAHHSH